MTEIVTEVGLKGGLAALKDGIFTAFEWNGFIIQRAGNSLAFSKGEKQLGGAALLESFSVAELAEWAKLKESYYNE